MLASPPQTSRPPGFYERLGYSLYGKLEKCPPGETVYYYWKELADESVPIENAQPDMDASRFSIVPPGI